MMSFGDRLFYFPTSAVYGRPETYGLRYETVWFRSADGIRLHGWFFPAEGTSRGTVVHFHGNGGNLTGHFEHVRWLPAAGWDVLCFDYRGYGQSEGQPTRAGTTADGKAAVEYVMGRRDVDAERVVVFGQSLGGAVGIVVAAMCPAVRGLAAEGAFSAYRQEAAFVSSGHLLLRPIGEWLSRTIVSQGYDAVDWIGQIAPRPLLLICGTRDTIVDYRQTLSLHEAAGEPKELWVIEGGGHTEALREEAGKTRLVGFLERCIARGDVGT